MRKLAGYTLIVVAFAIALWVRGQFRSGYAERVGDVRLHHDMSYGQIRAALGDGGNISANSPSTEHLHTIGGGRVRGVTGVRFFADLVAADFDTAGRPLDDNSS